MKYFFNIKMFKAYQWVKSNNFNRFQIKDTVLSELIKCWEKAEVKTWAKSDINPPFVRRRGSESLNNPGSVIPDCRCQRHKDQCVCCLCPALGPIITDHSRPPVHITLHDTFLGLGPWEFIRTGALRLRLRLEKKASMFQFYVFFAFNLNQGTLFTMFTVYSGQSSCSEAGHNLAAPGLRKKGPGPGRSSGARAPSGA